MRYAVAISGIVLHLMGALFVTASVWLLRTALRMVLGEGLLGPDVYYWLIGWLLTALIAIICAIVILSRPAARNILPALLLMVAGVAIAILVVVLERNSSSPGVNPSSIVIAAVYLLHAAFTWVWLAFRK